METWIQWGILVALSLLSAVIARQDWEIRQLRAYRHRLGEDPSHPLEQLIDIYHEESNHRLDRLERKVFNGVKP